jgi:hypothetical protein
MALPTLNVEKVDPEKKASSDLVQWWFKEMAAAENREKNWKKEAKEVVGIYESAETAQDNEYNILYSNTETLLPALYSNTPRPVVKRRYDDEDLVGKVGSQILKRALEYEIDSGLEENFTFDDAVEKAILDALVPGRGLTRFKLKSRESMLYVCREAVAWERFTHGYGRTWAQVPWVRFTHYLSREQVKQEFPGFTTKLTYENSVEASVAADDTSNMSGESDDKEKQKVGKIKVAEIWEIWDKRTKQVIFIAPSHQDQPLRKVADPLRLSGFFPIPQPLMFYKKVSGMVPSTLYSTYKKQAEELNLTTRRLTKLIDVMRVRGFYDATVEGIAELMTLNDGDFKALENVAAFRNGEGKVADAFWFMPIQELITVVQQLYVARESCKKVIYEIMGIADILRGSSVASETATAQDIKSKWGALRLKRWQKRVADYSRECIRIMAELTAEHLDKEELSEMTLVQLPSAEQKELAQQELTMIQQQMAAIQSMPEPQPGMPIPSLPPPPDPQKMQMLTSVVQMPSWEDVTSMFQSELRRSYHIDIETNSTLDVEASEDQKLIAEFLNAMAQFLNGVGPMVEKGAMKPEAANAIMLTIARRFRFGEDVEQYLQVEGGAGREAEMEKLMKELEAAQGENKQLKEQLSEAELASRVADVEAKAEARIQENVRKSEEAILMSKIEVLFTKHMSSVQEAISAAKESQSEVKADDFKALSIDLLEAIKGLAQPAQQSAPS